MKALRKPSLGASGLVTGILLDGMGKKLTNLNRYMSVSTLSNDIVEKWLVIFEHTINHFLSVRFIYPNLDTIFLFVIFFLTFYFFSSRAIFF